MKRDFDLIRSILLYIEEREDGSGNGIDIELEGVDEVTQYGHLKLLLEIGFIEALDSQTLGPEVDEIVVLRMTWSGHDFLDSIRDEAIWAKSLEKLKKTSGSTSLEVVKALAVSLAKQQLGLS